MAEEVEPSTLYFYNPSTAAAVLFTVLYGLIGLYHLHLHTTHPYLLRKKQGIDASPRSRCSHRHTIPTLIAANLSTAGYALRCASIQSPASISLYATSSTLIVIAPIFVCASLYLLLARLILRCLPRTNTTREAQSQPQQKFLHIGPFWLGRLFITSDILSFLTQAAGTSIAAGGDWVGDEARIGTNVLLTGLSLQLATFTVFILISTLFIIRVRRQNPQALGGGVKGLLLGAAIASVFVQVRSVYRVVEFALGIDGYPFRQEWCLYVLEAVPMLAALAALGWWHPVRCVPEGVVVRTRTRTKTGKVEVERGELEGEVGR